MDGLSVGNTFPLYSCAIAMVTIKRVLVIIAHGVVVWRLFMVNIQQQQLLDYRGALSTL
jgi:hypothetical protein